MGMEYSSTTSSLHDDGPFHLSKNYEFGPLVCRSPRVRSGESMTSYRFEVGTTVQAIRMFVWTPKLKTTKIPNTMASDLTY